jgi:DNA ligase (NAD+)
MKATVEELYEINGVGEKVALSIRQYFDDVKNQQFIKKLLDNGVKIQKVVRVEKSGKLFGKTFVLTGTLTSLTRDDAKEKIRNLGGEISESVSKSTSAVVVGENPGSKYEKARNLGITTLSESEFLELIKS